MTHTSTWTYTPTAVGITDVHVALHQGGYDTTPVEEANGVLQPDGSYAVTFEAPAGTYQVAVTTNLGTDLDGPMLTLPVRAVRLPGEPLQPWVTVEELPAPSSGQPDRRADAAQAATDLLWSLSGRIFSGPRQTTLHLLAAHCSHSRALAGPFEGMSTAHAARDTYLGLGCGCQRLVQLPDRDVREVTAVLVDGVALASGDWRLDSGSQLVRLDGGRWPLGHDEAQPRLTVTYLYGQDPPAGGRLAALALATAYLKATSGSACQLPQRVTTLSTEGVSLVFDDFAALREGSTGLPQADQWLASVNPQRSHHRNRTLSPHAARYARPAL